jgi:hypothetical protein
MTWQLPDTYHSAGHGRGTATLKFYEGRDNLVAETSLIRKRSCPGGLAWRPWTMPPCAFLMTTASGLC